MIYKGEKGHIRDPVVQHPRENSFSFSPEDDGNCGLVIWLFFSFSCDGKYNCFLFFLLHCLCTKVRDLCVLVLYPADLPDSLTHSCSFLVASSGLLCVESYPLQTCTVLLLFQFQFILFFFFFSLISMARTVLDKSDTS